MKKKENRISIIVPVYHGAKYLPDLISQVESCAEYVPDTGIELIFSNDAPDESLKETATSSYISIKVLNTDRNRGIHGARVRGLQNSTGDYILFLDQDDKIAPEYLKSQLSTIGAADAVVCNALSGGKLRYNMDCPLYKAADRECMIREGNMILSPGQVLLQRMAIPQVWMENIMHYNGADDWFLWLCMYAEGKRFVTNPDVLFFREIYYQNTSFDILKMAQSEKEVVEMIEAQKLLLESERKSLRELLPKLQEMRIKELEKFKKMFLVQNDWMGAMYRGQTIADHLREKMVEKVAVYGYGYLGKMLLEGLKGSGIEIAYVIDKNANYVNTGTACYTLGDVPEQVDAVIVTMVSENREMIETEIGKKLDTGIFWLEDIISNLAKRME